MASTKYANYIVDARGKVAGTIYSRNGGGSYARGSFSPTNTRSNRQTVQRANVKSIQSRWQSLTQQQRDTWESAAPNWPVQNRIGDKVILSGHQLFVHLNLNLRRAFTIVTQLTKPAKKPRFPVFTYSFITLDNTGAALTAVILQSVTLAGDSASFFRVIVYATKALTPGAYSPSRAKYKRISVFSGSNISLSFGLAYRTVFGVPAVGSQVFVKLEMLDTRSGMIEHVFTGSKIVT